MPELQQPDIVGNFLSSYGTAQAQQQAQKDRAFQQQRVMRQDEMAQQQFDWQAQDRALEAAAEATSKELRLLKPGDEVGFNAALQRLVQQGHIKPEDASKYNVSMLPDLLAADKQWREAQAFKMEQQAAGQRGRLTEAQIAAANRSNQGGGGSGVLNSALQRAQLAQAFGIDPASPAGQKFALTGQLPAALSPTDKKAIQEADQMVMATKQGLDMLNQAKALNPKAAGGFGMGRLADVFAQVGDQTAINTRDLENVLQSNVLPQLKAIFGGAITEGERQILLDLQGSADKTVEERKRIIDRSIAAANARLKFYQEQSADLRGGTYYSPTRGQQPAAQPAAPAAAKKKTVLPNGITIEELD